MEHNTKHRLYVMGGKRGMRIGIAIGILISTVAALIIHII